LLGVPCPDHRDQVALSLLAIPRTCHFGLRHTAQSLTRFQSTAVPHFTDQPQSGEMASKFQPCRIRFLNAITMRKLKLQMQITLDGFVAGPQGELDWITSETDERQVRYLQDLTANMGTILLGRKMADEAIPHWENVANAQTDGAEWEYAKTFVATPKIIFSRTLDRTNGKNASVERGDLKESVAKLKHQPGKDIVVYGGANFVSELIKSNLIDEYHVLVNPVAIGQGKTIFNGQHKLKLVKSTPFTNGVLANQYVMLH
jgi:dihydrofolate reductase